MPTVIKMLSSKFKFAESKIDLTELRINITGLKLNFQNQLCEIEFMNIVSYMMIFMQAFRHNRFLQG